MHPHAFIPMTGRPSGVPLFPPHWGRGTRASLPAAQHFPNAIGPFANGLPEGSPVQRPGPRTERTARKGRLAGADSPYTSFIHSIVLGTPTSSVTFGLCPKYFFAFEISGLLFIVLCLSSGRYSTSDSSAPVCCRIRSLSSLTLLNSSPPMFYTSPALNPSQTLASVGIKSSIYMKTRW
jgi:hypothetical protein